mgnify:FL=1
MSTKVNRELYQKLASDFEEERLQSTIEIIKTLNAIKQDDKEAYGTEKDYAIQRLIKALSSNKRFARLGYSLCLGEILYLDLDESIKVSKSSFIQSVYQKLYEHLPLNDKDTSSSNNKNKKVKGKEERGNAFGRLFGLQMISNQPLYQDLFFTNNEKSNFEYDVISDYIDELYKLHLYKSWISESALFAIFEFVVKILNDTGIHSEGKMKFRRFIVEKVDELKLTMSLEGLAIYIKLIFSEGDIYRNLETIQEVRMKNLHWVNQNPFDRSNITYLTKVLKGEDVISTKDQSTGNNNKGFWTPRLHFAYSIVINQLNKNHANDFSIKSIKKAKKSSSEDTNKNNLFTINDFMNKIIDETFFSEKASTERKYLGFEMIKSLFATDFKFITKLFGLKNFSRVLINQVSKTDRMLHSQATSVLKVISDYFEKNSTEISEFLIQIWQLDTDNETFVNFDTLTKSKLCSTLLATKLISDDEKMEFSKRLANICQQIADESLTEGSLKKYKFCIDQLLHFLKSHKESISVDDPKNWALYSIKKLCDLAFFKTIKENEQSDEEFEYDEEDLNNLHVIANDRLHSVINELLVGNDSHIMNYVLQYIIQTENSKKLLFKLDEQLSTIKLEAVSVLVDIKNTIDEGVSEVNLLKSLKTLVELVILRVYGGSADCLQILDDLLIFYQKKIIEKEEGIWTGLSEIYLALLSDSQSFSKKSIFASFKNIMEVFQNENLESYDEFLKTFVDVLAARENKSGFDKLFGDDFEAVAEEDEKDESNKEVVSEEDDEKEEEEENSSESDNSDDDIDLDDISDIEFEGASDSDGDKVTKIELETSNALAKALNLPANVIDENGNVNHDALLEENDDSSIQSDNSDEEEEILDDEQMFQLDSTLSNIFKHRKEALSSVNTGNKRKEEVQNARETVVAIKTKVIDLIEIAVKVNESLLENTEGVSDDAVINSINKIVYFTIPLISCIRTTTSKQLADKAAKLIKSKLTKVKVNGVNDNSVFAKHLSTKFSELNQELLNEKPGLYSKLFYTSASNISLFYAKLIWNFGSVENKFNYLMIQEAYTKLMEEWIITPTSKLPQSYFLDLINWVNNKRQSYLEAEKL